MKEETAQITTGELWARLFAAPKVERYLDENSVSCERPSFAEYITQLANGRNEKPERIINRSGIERSFGHRLFSGTRNPSRDTVLQLAFGFELDADGAQDLLKIAQMTPLHPKVKRDAVIAFCLHHQKTLIEAQCILHDNALPILGGSKI